MYYLRIVEKSLKKDKETGKVHSVEDYVQNTCFGSWYNKIMPDDDIFSLKDCAGRTDSHPAFWEREERVRESVCSLELVQGACC